MTPSSRSDPLPSLPSPATRPATCTRTTALTPAMSSPLPLPLGLAGPLSSPESTDSGTSERFGEFSLLSPRSDELPESSSSSRPRTPSDSSRLVQTHQDLGPSRVEGWSKRRGCTREGGAVGGRQRARGEEGRVSASSASRKGRRPSMLTISHSSLSVVLL